MGTLLLIYFSLVNLNPNLKPLDAFKKTLAIAYTSQEYDLNWKKVTAILFQESSLQNDPQGCLKGNCGPDRGIGQVRIAVWGKELKIDKVRILKDTLYAVGLTGKILDNYKKRFAKNETNWYSRYHSGHKKFRSIYEKKINKHLNKIDKLIGSYVAGR